jgi:hypothetical protein
MIRAVYSFLHPHAAVSLHALLLAAGPLLTASPALARDPGPEAQMIRVLSCEGFNVEIELYLPQSIATKGIDALRKMRPTIGYYLLDLSALGKGKPLDPVRVSMSADGKFVIVDQYIRRLPPTRVPVSGGVVSFDERFGFEAACGPFELN